MFQTRNELARVNSEDVIGEVGDTKFDNYVKIITLLLFNGALPQMHYLSSNYQKKLAAFMTRIKRNSLEAERSAKRSIDETSSDEEESPTDGNYKSKLPMLLFYASFIIL